MPLIRIELREGKPPEYLHAISEAVQLALVEVFTVPVRDQFQVFTQHSPGSLVYNPNYLGIDRSQNFLKI